MSDLMKRIADLSPEKQRLLLAQLNKKQGKTLQIQPQKRDTSLLPLSVGQERLWFLQQLDSNSTAYTMSLAMRVQGPFQLAALEQSVQKLLQRHEVLRTTFTEQEGRPFQVIAPSSYTIRVPVIDLRELPFSVREQTLQQLVRRKPTPFLICYTVLCYVSRYCGWMHKNRYCCSRCITSSRMVGRWVSWFVSFRPSMTRKWRSRPRNCQRCRFNMRTMRSGSVPGWQAIRLSSIWTIGVLVWRAHLRF